MIQDTGRSVAIVANDLVIKVYRLCKELDVLKPQRKLKARYPRKLARNRLITALNQLWEVDLKYGYIAGEDRYFFILSYIDVFDRQIVATILA